MAAIGIENVILTPLARLEPSGRAVAYYNTSALRNTTVLGELATPLLAAAAEAGYGVRMMKMLHPGAGLKNDVIVGFPRGADPLREHVFGPNASF